MEKISALLPLSKTNQQQILPQAKSKLQIPPQAKCKDGENIHRLIPILQKFRTDFDKFPAEPCWPQSSLNAANHHECKTSL